jgi:hypothetical protein
MTEPTLAVTVHQAAAAIPLSVSMVRKLIRQGVIATVPHTGSRVLERYVNQRPNHQETPA